MSLYPGKMAIGQLLKKLTYNLTKAEGNPVMEGEYSIFLTHRNPEFSDSQVGFL